MNINFNTGKKVDRIEEEELIEDDDDDEQEIKRKQQKKHNAELKKQLIKFTS